jgi:hypothetical protein
MGAEDVTADQLLEDICQAIDTAFGPRKPEGKGWYCLSEIANAKGVKNDFLRDKLARMVEWGLMERVKIGATYYYRKTKKNGE